MIGRWPPWLPERHARGARTDAAGAECRESHLTIHVGLAYEPTSSGLSLIKPGLRAVAVGCHVTGRLSSARVMHEVLNHGRRP